MDSPNPNDKSEPFPALSPIASSAEASRVGTNNGQSNLPRPQTSPDTVEPQTGLPGISSSATTPTRTRRTRGSSLLHTIANSNPPLGMWQATGELSSRAPTLPEIRNGSFSAYGWSHEGQCEKRNQDPHEIHRRRLSRTSSWSTETGRTRSTKGTITEKHEEYSPGPTLPEETEMPSIAATSQHTESAMEEVPQVKEPRPRSKLEKEPGTLTMSTSVNSVHPSRGPDETGTYPNGYRFPKKHTWTQSMAIGAKAFWRFFLTIPGFLITIYGLNVVAWGAMIFFVLIPGATPAMCHPDCEAINSPRKIWIEIDSQILNALFCVTGFGLLPWRLRDFYFLARWRIWGKHDAHRRLAGIYRGWYRLPGSENLPEHMSPPLSEEKKRKKMKGDKVLPEDEESPPPYTPEQLSALESNPAVPLPPTSMPDAPLTGIRAAPTKSWNLDIIIWMYILNSAFQACLAGFMWGMNRFNRPSWATGFFITIGCVTGIVAGIVVFVEGSKVKKAEGIPIKEYDVLESVEDFQERKAKEDEKEKKKEERKEKKISLMEKANGGTKS